MNRSKQNLTRVAVAGSGAALLAGLAVPAYACLPADPASLKPASVTAHPATLTVAGLKAKVDAFVAKRLAALSAEAARVAASTRLSAVTNAQAQARIAAEVAALNSLKAQVDGESTTAAIKADLAAAWLAELRTHADARVDRSIAQVTALVAKVQGSTKLSDAKKAAMVAKLQAKLAALTALKAKIDAEASAKAVLADLRAADALWAWDARSGRHSGKGDPGKHKDGDGKVESAVWTKNGHKGHDPKCDGVSMRGRGHASRSAGHHGFGGSHHGGASRH